MKKFFCAMICAVMLASMICGIALAAPKNVSETELQAKVDAANAKIVALVNHAIETPENDVKKLQQDVKKIVHEVKAYAKKVGVEVGCNMVTYYIDGQWVDIDPLFVVNIRQ